MIAGRERVQYLVVGASGLVGGALFRRLDGAGHRVVGTQASARIAGLAGFDLMSERIADRIDPAFFAADHDTIAVICASICQIDRCRRERAVTRIVNVDHTIRLIDDLVGLGVKPVFLSSGFVFDGARGYYAESSECAPICEYGRQKLAVEEYLLANVPSALIARLDKVVSDDPAEEHLFTEWRRLLSADRPITCIRGQLFAPTFVGDIARAVAVSCELGLSGLYHVANPEFFTREELARQFAWAMGGPSEILSKPLEEFAFDDPRPLKTYLDSTKFLRAADFRFTSMREVMRSFLGRTQAIPTAGASPSASPA